MYNCAPPPPPPESITRNPASRSTAHSPARATTQGIPDWHKMPASLPSSTPLEDPVLAAITAAHAPATAAQVTLSWLWSLGLPSNPRSMNPSHMADNLAAIGTVTLSAAEISQLSSRPMDSCDIDPDFYGAFLLSSMRATPLSPVHAVPSPPCPSSHLAPRPYRMRPEGRLQRTPAPVAEARVKRIMILLQRTPAPVAEARVKRLMIKQVEFFLPSDPNPSISPASRC